MSVPVLDTIGGIREAVRAPSSQGAAVGLVPTMGALHAGHARLIKTARAQSGLVVVSIFVNPIQFERRDDYERYGRSLAADVELCGRAGADLIFAPSVDEMYPAPLQTSVEVSGVTDSFCGRARPGHFRGVTTVVTKLFHIVGPQLAFFGEKDFQQLAAIRRMVEDLNFPIRIVAVETVRDPDGLALSSRNARLGEPERQLATRLFRALAQARDSIAAGERDAPAILARAGLELEYPGIQIDYLGLADPVTLQPVDRVDGPVQAMGAIWIGGTRLIDNLRCLPG